MMYFDLFVYLFVILVGLYIVINFKNLTRYDAMILATSAIILLIIVYQYKKTNLKEHFTTNTNTSTDLETILNNYELMNTEEDITGIQNRLIVYLTIYNKVSFDNMGKTWYNIATIKKDGTCEKDNNTLFNFELAPVFSRLTGLYLGNNRIIGPLSSSLGIQFHNTYTIMLACKHGNLLVHDQNDEIELLKLYANSSNNNGISLYIQRNSLQNNNNTQTGNLLFQYANVFPYDCKVDPSHNYINFDKDTLTFYFIVKDTDNIRVLMMTETSNVIYPILKFTVSNTDINFSNKEMGINRLLNWNGSMYSFAVYDRALSDENVSGLYAHCMSEYLKNIDPNFNQMIDQYNNTINMLKTLGKCPYDKITCDSCGSVTKWNDPTQIVNAPLNCKKAISNFCQNNPTHSLCKCWDTASTLYNTDNCKLYRKMFSDDQTINYDDLTAEEIEYIKKKFGLIYPHECPSLVDKPKYIQNNYPKYDWDKLKVSLENENSPHNPNKNKNSFDPDEDKHDFSVTDYIQKDPNINKPVTLPAVLQENIKQTKINSTTLPSQDSFFTKFMKVILPS